MPRYPAAGKTLRCWQHHQWTRAAIQAEQCGWHQREDAHAASNSELWNSKLRALADLDRPDFS